jgi:predicted lipoprotein with Yx(FWY)xxD motif
MRYAREKIFLMLALLGMTALAACSGYGSGAGSSTPATSEHPGVGIVATATATVAGKSETILTDSQGMTLYAFAHDTATSSACTGGCASTWPPLLVLSGTPSSDTALSGTLSVLADPNGSQVVYNGHPLYRYASDSAPGDTRGEGIEGLWHVVTPDLTLLPPSGTPSVTPMPGNPYGFE